jgi:hypothetical protein
MVTSSFNGERYLSRFLRILCFHSSTSGQLMPLLAEQHEAGCKPRDCTRSAGSAQSIASFRRDVGHVQSDPQDCASPNSNFERDGLVGLLVVIWKD